MAMFVLAGGGYGQDLPRGTIKGRVLDAETRTSLPAASVRLADTQMGAMTDLEGNFVIDDVPVGSYTVQFGYIGYEPLSKTDVIVRPKRITTLRVELKVSAIEMDAVVVTGGYFARVEDQPTSSMTFSAEEIRRAPGSAGDVSRILYGLPSVAKVNDTKNSLIVRGGGAFENGFYLDNIEIPNINHFPEHGSSGGPIGMLNVDFIQDVDFHTGGFSAVYGDRLSSVMDLSFREGNRDEFDGQLDLSFAGFGGVAEGPLGHGKGSWLASARKSFLDLIVEAIGEDEGSVPNYGDLQGKVIYDLSDSHTVTMLDILGIDAIGNRAEDAVENKENMYIDFGFLGNTFGINWQYLWGDRGYSNTSISHTLARFDFEGFETRHYMDTGTDKLLFDMEGSEQAIKIRNVNYYTINRSHKLEFGVDLKRLDMRYDNHYGEYNDHLGRVTPAYRVDDDIGASKAQAFLSYIWGPWESLTVTPGIRVHHFTYNKHTTVSPRFSLSYRIGENTSVNASTGVFHQSIPLPLLVQNDANKELKELRAYHYVLGFHHLLTENTRLTIEVYDKEYRNFPLDPIQPSLSVMDLIVYDGIFLNGNPLIDGGRAFSRGVEVMIQKKLARDVYGMISGSYFRSRYRDYDGTWRDRVYDNRYTCNIEGGYKPNNKWEFSLRWIYAGGVPYTPFDQDASEAAGRGVFDANRINGERQPDYHSLNVRLDRRFLFSGSNLIFYLSVWNAYGRKNISDYYWNEVDNRQEPFEQWGTLPIFGLEYEF